MDKRRSEEITTPNSLKPDSEVSKDKGSYTHLVNEGFLAGQRIAKISVVTLISIGIIELVMGLKFKLAVLPELSIRIV